jgi:transcription-repair coupling factor (superfamily II helicase)
MFYKRIASVVTQEELDRARDEMQDRYGRLPEQGLNLLELARLRLLAEKLRVQQVDYRAGALLVKFSDSSPIEPEHVLRYVRRRSDATFSPPGILRIKGTLSEPARLATTRELLMALA